MEKDRYKKQRKINLLILKLPKMIKKEEKQIKTIRKMPKEQIKKMEKEMVNKLKSKKV